MGLSDEEKLYECVCSRSDGHADGDIESARCKAKCQGSKPLGLIHHAFQRLLTCSRKKMANCNANTAGSPPLQRGKAVIAWHSPTLRNLQVNTRDNRFPQVLAND
eukprot:Gb_21875 [translate_table: standard]